MTNQNHHANTPVATHDANRRSPAVWIVAMILVIFVVMLVLWMSGFLGGSPEDLPPVERDQLEMDRTGGSQ